MTTADQARDIGAPPPGVPEHLAPFWQESSKAEVTELARWLSRNPSASPEQIAEHRHALRVAIAAKAAAHEHRTNERMAAMEAAMTCPACNTPRAMRVTLLRFPPVGDAADRAPRLPAMQHTLGDIQALSMARQLNPKAEERDDDDRPPRPVYRPEPEGQLVSSPIGTRQPIFVCARCKPVVEAAIVGMLRDDHVGESTTRGDLADDFARQMIAAARPIKSPA